MGELAGSLAVSQPSPIQPAAAIARLDPHGPPCIDAVAVLCDHHFGVVVDVLGEGGLWGHHKGVAVHHPQPVIEGQQGEGGRDLQVQAQAGCRLASPGGRMWSP